MSDGSIHNYEVYTDSAVDVVFSPDDGGWYLLEIKTVNPFYSRSSKKIYPSSHEAKRAFDRGQVKWSKWS